jgi:hypothetical protein
MEQPTERYKKRAGEVMVADQSWKNVRGSKDRRKQEKEIKFMETQEEKLLRYEEGMTETLEERGKNMQAEIGRERERLCRLQRRGRSYCSWKKEGDNVEAAMRKKNGGS